MEKSFWYLSIAIFSVYMVAFGIYSYHVFHWLKAVFEWHRQIARRDGVLRAVLNFYNPFLLWKNIQAIRREIPGADKAWRQSFRWIFICTGIMSLFGLVALGLAVWLR
jgi:hypothetical protein